MLLRKFQTPVKVFTMERIKSDYVGTEEKIHSIGVFDCYVEQIQKAKQTEKGFEDVSSVRIYAPAAYKFKVGYGVSTVCGSYPEYRIVSITQPGPYSVCEVDVWT